MGPGKGEKGRGWKKATLTATPVGAPHSPVICIAYDYAWWRRSTPAIEEIQSEGFILDVTMGF
jgi:hypothetical protein